MRALMQAPVSNYSRLQRQMNIRGTRTLRGSIVVARRLNHMQAVNQLRVNKQLHQRRERLPTPNMFGYLPGYLL